MSTAIRCGNCKESHGSVAEVRVCHGAPAVTSTIKAAHQNGAVAKLSPPVSIPDGYFTVVIEGEGHRTFRVKKARSGALEGKRIISYLMGPDNTSDYQGFGFVFDSGVTFWKRFKEDSVLGYAVRVLEGNPDQAQEDYALESGNCFRCGKMLTVPVSLHRGVGPECAKILGM